MFKSIDPKKIEDNPIKLIGEDWMLISAANADKLNAMTASWGGIGVMWGKPCVFVFIRPQRYTYEFISKSETFSLSFFAPEHKEALKICGSKSGRDCDKISLSGLSAEFTECGTPYFTEARLVLICKKMYEGELSETGFIDRTQIGRWYPQKDFHRVFIASIETALIKE